ncbi:MAG: hypothetical protein JWM82_26 [Myxococcales bacterium]|nr:hypothetical protein [Myxococcales bacterium]
MSQAPMMAPAPQAPPSPASAEAPGRGTWLAIIAAWLAYTILLGILYARMPAGPDEQIFDYIAWVADRGGHLYVDATEQNFPGMMWIHELSTAVFGVHYWSHHAFDYLQLLAGCFILAAALAPEVGRRRALLVIPIYQAMYVTLGWWSAGQRDVVVAPLLLGAGLAYRARARGGPRAWLALFAVALIGAAAVRPTYAAYAALIVLADVLTARGRDRALARVLSDTGVAAGFCVALVGALVLGASASGTLGPFLESSLRFNTQVYSHSISVGAASRSFAGLLHSWHWYVAFGVAGAWLWFREGRDRFLWAVVALVAVTGVLSAYVQLKGFGYHLCAVVTTAAVFDTYLVLWSLRRIRARSDLGRIAVAASIALVVVAGLASKVRSTYRIELEGLVGRRSEREVLETVGAGTDGTTFTDLLDAVAYVRGVVPENERVLVWTRAVHINFLAERRSPTRFITAGMLISARPPFQGADAWTREFADAFAQAPPVVIIIPSRDIADGVELWNDARPSGAVQILRRELTTRYTHVHDFGKLEAYRLNVPAGS